ncbi:MAG TPA: FGGY family carbohydrate kinase, partial [Candidatus Saccharimonadales bacterium]|nr:FGGY family carbohydrate kinase [Candidatus Saccharimonadales bacterium]
MADAVLGIDLGTTEVKIGLFTLDGEQIGLTRRPYPMLADVPGAAEQDPRHWWTAIVEGARALGPERARTAAICAVGQGPTLVAVDAAGNPVRRAITWLDRRPARDAAARGSAKWFSDGAAEAGARAGVEAGADGGGHAATGAGEAGARGETPGTAGFGLAPAIDWLARHDPEAAARARWLLSAWDWVGLRLSGVATTSLQREEPEARLPADPTKIAPAVPVGQAIGRLLPAAGKELGL